MLRSGGGVDLDGGSRLVGGIGGAGGAAGGAGLTDEGDGGGAEGGADEEDEGGGGAEGGVGLEDVKLCCGWGKPTVETFLLLGGLGGGFFPRTPVEALDFSSGFFKFANRGFDAAGAESIDRTLGRVPGIGGAGADGIVGGRRAEPKGSRGVAGIEDSGSDEYVESPWSAPVSTPPPLLFSFGMPPTKIPPS